MEPVVDTISLNNSISMLTLLSEFTIVTLSQNPLPPRDRHRELIPTWAVSRSEFPASMYFVFLALTLIETKKLESSGAPDADSKSAYKDLGIFVSRTTCSRREYRLQDCLPDAT